MGSLRLALRAGSVAAVACVSAPVTAYGVAGAGDVSGGGNGAGVSVAPAAPVPGGDVRLTVYGCGGRTGTGASGAFAESGAFVAKARLVGEGDGTLGGDTRVRTALRPGTYAVTVDCGGTGAGAGTGTGTSTGTSTGSAQVKGALTVADPSAAPSVPASPVAPVPAGGGYAAHLAAARTGNGGPGLLQAVVGLVLVAVAASTVALLTRARRRARRD